MWSSRGALCLRHRVCSEGPGWRRGGTLSFLAPRQGRGGLGQARRAERGHRGGGQGARKGPDKAPDPELPQEVCSAYFIVGTQGRM